MFHTVICDMLGIRYPILQGAMQGGGGPALVAAVGDAGGLGVLPSFGGSAEDLRENILAVRARSDKPFAVNIMPMGPGFTESRVDVVIEMGVGIVTTGRADPGEVIVRRLKDAGVTVISVIPTVEHARRMVAEGVDAVVASGTEAGGHVGRVATLPLVPMVADAVDVPVLAAGGIGDGRGFLAAFALGAVGVQIGTRFMATRESEMNRWGVDTLLEMRETDTVVTKAMTGATVRCIATPELLAYEKAREGGASQSELTALMRAARGGKTRDRSENRRQYATGQIAGMIHDVPTVAELIERIVREAAELAEELPAIARR
jgi:enoyl-[acyl-carrier protein] reductase II